MGQLQPLELGDHHSTRDQHRRHLHLSVMVQVTSLEVLWPARVARADQDLLLLHHHKTSHNRVHHNIRCLSRHQDCNKVHQHLNSHLSSQVATPRVRPQTVMAHSLRNRPHLQDQVSAVSFVDQEDQQPRNSISRCHTQIQEHLHRSDTQLQTIAQAK